MTRIYQIIPLEKKSVVITYEVFEASDDDTGRGFEIEETYRWGAGYREEDDPVSVWELNNNGIYCNPSMGTESEDLISCYFEFDAGFTDQEKATIEQDWENGGAGWLYDGEHNWKVESSSIVIYGPVKINLIDDITGDIIEENVAPPATEVVNLEWKTISADEPWPFPTK